MTQESPLPYEIKPDGMVELTLDRVAVDTPTAQTMLNEWGRPKPVRQNDHSLTYEIEPGQLIAQFKKYNIETPEDLLYANARVESVKAVAQALDCMEAEDRGEKTPNCPSPTKGGKGRQ